MPTPGHVRFCPSCGSGQIDITFGERMIDAVETFFSLATYCHACGWSGYIEPDIPEWEEARWENKWFIDLKR